jgi:hypothetical protein
LLSPLASIIVLLIPRPSFEEKLKKPTYLHAPFSATFIS